MGDEKLDKKNEGEISEPKKEVKKDEVVNKQPTVYEILQYDVSVLESQTSGRDFKLGAKIVRHLKILKRKMNVNHVLALQSTYFPDEAIARRFRDLANFDENFPEKHNFETKETYQPATVIFLKTVLLTFMMKNKLVDLVFLFLK